MLKLNRKMRCICRSCCQLLLNRLPKVCASLVQPRTEAATDLFFLLPFSPNKQGYFYFVETKWTSARDTWNNEWPYVGYLLLSSAGNINIYEEDSIWTMKGMAMWMWLILFYILSEVSKISLFIHEYSVT